MQYENPPSLSTMLKCAGRFFYRRMATKDSFTKMYSSPSDLVQLLQSRGLVIFDREKAKHYLSHIGYYRLSAYSYPMLSFPIKQAVSFDKVMMLYHFDKNLRLHCCSTRWRKFTWAFFLPLRAKTLINMMFKILNVLSCKTEKSSSPK